MYNAGNSPHKTAFHTIARRCLALAFFALLASLAILLASCSSDAQEGASSDVETQEASVLSSQEGSAEGVSGDSSGAVEPESEEGSASSVSPGETVDWAGNVEEFLQFPVLQGGCEVASLSCVLRSMGYDEVDEYTIAEEYLEYGDMVSGYSGDPYYYGSAFPPPLMDAANAFLEANGAEERALDLSGLGFDVVAEWVQAGYPVLVWTTMYMEEPDLTGTMVGPYEWWNNEHCVVVYGFDESGDVLVMDPLDGLTTRDRQDFARIYEECGSLSYVIC